MSSPYESKESIRREIDGQHGPTVAARWRQYESLLGRAADADLAYKIGISRSRVQHYRQRLGIPAYRADNARNVTVDVQHAIVQVADQLGKRPDSELAAEINVSAETIRRHRVAAGIPAWRPRRRKWTGADNHIILNHDNETAASLLQTTVAAVKTQRSRLNKQHDA